jgi:hypothetical protein
VLPNSSNRLCVNVSAFRIPVKAARSGVHGELLYDERG